MIRSKCVRVPREKGEETRQRLMELDALDHSLRIKSAEGYLYLPVVEGAEIPSEFTEEFADGLEVESREFERADTLDAPADILGYEPSFEVVGDVALIEYENAETRREVADALVEADNNVVGVLNVESKVKGEERTREMRHVAGEEKTEVVHREYGSEFLLDLTDVYFSPRLANERQRVVSKIKEGETVFDMFAGVGPFAVQAAEKVGENGKVVAVDINPDAVEYLRENAERNKVKDRIRIFNTDVREVASGVEADRIIMNLPHTANEFLGAAMEAARDGTVVHYYDIRHENDLFEGAVEEIERVGQEHGFEIEVLDEVNVRSYAPKEYNVCVDFAVREA